MTTLSKLSNRSNKHRGRASAGDVRESGRWAGPWFILPFVAFYVLFLIWPSLAMLGYSFTDRSLAGGPVSWVGIENWVEALGDPYMWRSLWITLLFTLLSVPPLVALGAALAILTDHARRLGWFLRMAFFAPFVLPVAVMTMIWTWLYQPGFGLINQYLQMMGLQEVEWLGNEGTVLIAIVIATVWWTVGFNFVLYLAALQGIPRETYEAAGIDGAGAWRKIRHITIPQLKRTTGLVTVLQVIASLRIFDQAYLMGGDFGGPNFASRTFIHYIYETGFVNFRLGLGSAMAWVLTITMVLVSVLLFRFFTRDGR
ncbi:sugar ABC transporter permease [Spiractinospora alimapuensis]|uniref:carbohydrate ABC transporter permease n=1 Tax=Spiractinospora alimapuensis TaxID=2820884 RepID=UPI001F2C4B02|nr:sugar ABC transporter permease [Spiractinospora alimapuensis]QVQ53582.1 sugar ABC transporter permease [Spiractinospora alimapuensis]